EELMSHAAAILPHHLNRTAMVYVRQSTPKQLVVHQESTRRQYQLVERAATLGWPQPRIVVVDEDLGRSGASSETRLGFQRLVSAIGLGEVGLVLVTEVSRLSRLNSDWHRVLELCAVFDTLLADDEGIYDLRDPNDRLVLGLKGTLFAAELHILQARMRAGLLNKARRGALELRLPVGLRRQPDGTVVLDPDEQVQWTVRTLFERFARLQNARAVQRSFQSEGLLMPRFVQDGTDQGHLVWVKPTYQMLTQILTSPVYAGMFVYGRRVQQTRPGDPPHSFAHRLPEDEWEIVVSGVYPAYISEEQYAHNREQLRANMYNFIHRHPGAPREGTALVQGLVLCGRCGRRMQVQYSKQGPRYVCRDDAMRYATSTCQSFGQRYLDEAVCACFFEAVKPAQLEMLLAALSTLEQERQTREKGWQLRLERARYAVRLAERQYDAVDPENRLVARALEKRWNEALESLSNLEREYAVAQKTTLLPLTPEEQEAVRQLSLNVPTIWEAPTTTMADRKRLLRTVVQEITLTPTAPRTASLTILWSGGITTSHEVLCPPIGWHCLAPAALVERLRDLASRLPDHQIAELLNAEEVRTPTGKPWTAGRVASLRKQHAIATACPVEPGAVAVRGDGLISTTEAARRLQVSRSLVNVWLAHGVLTGDQRSAGSDHWVCLTEQDAARLSGQIPCAHFLSIHDLMRLHQCSAEEVWQYVRRGAYLPYRRQAGNRWEWRFCPQDCPKA
ncbi:MAG: recombinase family protein, partial [Ktedonobacteraceae bacterium]